MSCLSFMLMAPLALVGAYPKIGGYMPVSNVREHMQMSLDVTSFLDALDGDAPNYDEALKIYEKGGGESCKSASKQRTLQAFALKEFGGLGYQADWNPWMLAGLKGTGDFKDLPRGKRVTSLKKGVLGLMTYYSSWELESSISKAKTEDSRSDGGSGHAWDEGWAFYYGADAGGKNSPWEVAKKRDADFPNGTQVNPTILAQFNQGLISVRNATYNSADADEAKASIYRLWTITYLRAAYKYLQLSEHSYSEKAHAEGYAYYKAISKFISRQGSTGATADSTMTSALAITKTAIASGTYCAAKKAMENAYAQMQINCSMIGSFSDEKITCEACNDTAATFGAGASAVAEVAGTLGDDVKCPVKDTNTDSDSSSSLRSQWAYALTGVVTVFLLNSRGSV
jgi:hypothetical protein